MSTALATALPLISDATLPVRHVEIVPDRAQRRARPKAVYAVVIVGSLGVLMLAQLALSIAVSEGAYRIDGLLVTQKEQARTVQELTEDLGRLSSPQNLAANAEALGMVQNANPVWLRMSDGAVIGSPTAAAGGEGVMGATGSKVANELLAGIPLVTQLPADATATAAAQTPATQTPAAQTPASQTPASGQAAGSQAAAGAASSAVAGEASTSAAAAPLASDGRIPAPTTR